MDDVHELLASVPLFAGVPRDLLDELRAAVQPVYLPAGGWLFRAGDRGDLLYIVSSGRASRAPGTCGRARARSGAGPRSGARRARSPHRCAPLGSGSSRSRHRASRDRRRPIPGSSRPRSGDGLPSPALSRRSFSSAAAPSRPRHGRACWLSLCRVGAVGRRTSGGSSSSPSAAAPEASLRSMGTNGSREARLSVPTLTASSGSGQSCFSSSRTTARRAGRTSACARPTGSSSSVPAGRRPRSLQAPPRGRSCSGARRAQASRSAGSSSRTFARTTWSTPATASARTSAASPAASAASHSGSCSPAAARVGTPTSARSRPWWARASSSTALAGAASARSSGRSWRSAARPRRSSRSRGTSSRAARRSTTTPSRASR